MLVIASMTLTWSCGCFAQESGLEWCGGLAVLKPLTCSEPIRPCSMPNASTCCFNSDRHKSQRALRTLAPSDDKDGVSIAVTT